jgi:predicted AAA+ superfamily ATPase
MVDTPLLARHLRGEIENALDSARVVNVIGPRQVGKTTLVRDLLGGGGRYVSLDDTGVLAAIEGDPYGQLVALADEAGDGPVIIDEAQRSRSVALAIKRIVDERRRMGQFLLTGSSNVFTAAHVADSLAGRVQTLMLPPLSAAEIHHAGPPLLLDWAANKPSPALLPPVPFAARQLSIDLMVRGGYPEIRALPDRARNKRYRDAVDAIVDRDVADVLKVRKTDALRRLINQLAARTANELTIEDLCSGVGVQRQTLEAYLDALTRLSVVTRLGAWASGAAKREIKRPKIHLLDTGVAAALRGFTPTSFVPDNDPMALGGILETYVHNEVAKSLPYQAEEWRLYHWRNQDGREVDILAESGRTLVAMEVKAAAALDGDDLANLRWFKTEGPGKAWSVVGLVFYLGDRVLSFGNDIYGLPLSLLWGWGSAPT